jgi:hypothetical protein
MTARAAARVSAVGVLQAAGALVTVTRAAPGRPGPGLAGRRGQLGWRQPGRQHRGRATDPGGVRTHKLRQDSRSPSGRQRTGHDRRKPVALAAGQRPARPQAGEEFPRAAAEARPVIRCDRVGVARARGGGGWFCGWFQGRFGCNCCTPFRQQLHPVAAVAAPRRRCEVQWLHPVRFVIHRPPSSGVQLLHPVTRATRGPGCPRRACPRPGRSGRGTGAPGPPGPRRPGHHGPGAWPGPSLAGAGRLF